MKPNQRTILVSVAAVILIVGFLLWFNRYSFREMKIGDSTFPIRTSRFTGNSEVFVMGRWTHMGGESFALKPGDIRKIDGRAEIRMRSVGGISKCFLNCSVYNGTSVSLAELTVRLEIKETDKQKGFIREYRLRPNNGGMVLPLSNGDFEAEIGLEMKPLSLTDRKYLSDLGHNPDEYEVIPDSPESGKWSWGIVGSSGVR